MKIDLDMLGEGRPQKNGDVSQHQGDELFHAKRYVSHDGLSLYYRDYGETLAGTPILCLHGLTRNSKDFEQLAPILLELGRRVLVPDVRGRGQSDYDSRPENYHTSIYAEDVLELLEAESINKVAVIGTSMGGMVALSLALMQPEILAGVVLNDVGPEIDPVGLAHIISYVGQVVSFSSWEDAENACRFIASAAYPTLNDEGWRSMTRRLFKEQDGHIIGDYDPAISELFRSVLPSGPAPQLWEGFDRMRAIPVLTIRGALSNILSTVTYEEMCFRMPEMTAIEVPNVGHVPLLTEPESLKSIKDWLGKIS